MILFFDIETISNFNKKERKQKSFLFLQEKYWDKLNFMPEFNKILCISVGFMNDTEVITRSYHWDENEVINKFFEAIKWREIAGFNIKWFDIPFIIKRALFHKIEIPSCLKFYWKKPREMEYIIDLQEIYKSWVFSSFSNLDLVCKFLWITSPKEEWIDWSQVQRFYDLWKEKEIFEYCERDVKATIELYNYFKKYNII